MKCKTSAHVTVDGLLPNVKKPIHHHASVPFLFLKIPFSFLWIYRIVLSISSLLSLNFKILEGICSQCVLSLQKNKEFNFILDLRTQQPWHSHLDLINGNTNMFNIAKLKMSGKLFCLMQGPIWTMSQITSTTGPCPSN